MLQIKIVEIYLQWSMLMKNNLSLCYADLFAAFLSAHFHHISAAI
jgi:hypothetical protein